MHPQNTPETSTSNSASPMFSDLLSNDKTVDPQYLSALIDELMDTLDSNLSNKPFTSINGWSEILKLQKLILNRWDFEEPTLDTFFSNTLPSSPSTTDSERMSPLSASQPSKPSLCAILRRKSRTNQCPCCPTDEKSTHTHNDHQDNSHASEESSSSDTSLPFFINVLEKELKSAIDTAFTLQLCTTALSLNAIAAINTYKESMTSNAQDDDSNPFYESEMDDKCEGQSLNGLEASPMHLKQDNSEESSQRKPCGLPSPSEASYRDTPDIDAHHINEQSIARVKESPSPMAKSPSQPPALPVPDMTLDAGADIGFSVSGSMSTEDPVPPAIKRETKAVHPTTLRRSSRIQARLRPAPTRPLPPVKSEEPNSLGRPKRDHPSPDHTTLPLKKRYRDTRWSSSCS
ncbi:hypothetical protein BGZ94_003739 [Podila epigama]|nr:hypothetical protein BGZ94_003739 [Podila epigama]